jgi:16S rRNA (cytosine1402-N4)-methyltransferase
MINEFKHISVMPEEVLQYLKPQSGQVYVDGTLGGGGHAGLILNKIGPTGKLIGIDQDEQAINYASQVLKKYNQNLLVVRDNFRNLEKIIKSLGIGEVDGILLDLGVSTHQILSPQRGFSFSLEQENLSQKLDMRMDVKAKVNAADILNNFKQEELVKLFYQLGEEKYSKSIVKEIIKRRPLVTIGDLIEAIKAGTPPSYRQGKPPAKWASNVFRALRMEVNQELLVIEEALIQSLSCLKPGGRLVVITFHSIEDRLVKKIFSAWAKEVPSMPGFESLQIKPKVQNLTKKPILPSQSEQAQNPASKSAKLRAVIKI